MSLHFHFMLQIMYLSYLWFIVVFLLLEYKP